MVNASASKLNKYITKKYNQIKTTIKRHNGANHDKLYRCHFVLQEISPSKFDGILFRSVDVEPVVLGISMSPFPVKKVDPQLLFDCGGQKVQSVKADPKLPSDVPESHSVFLPGAAKVFAGAGRICSSLEDHPSTAVRGLVTIHHKVAIWQFRIRIDYAHAVLFIPGIQ